MHSSLRSYDYCEGYALEFQKKMLKLIFAHYKRYIPVKNVQKLSVTSLQRGRTSRQQFSPSVQHPLQKTFETTKNPFFKVYSP